MVTGLPWRSRAWTVLTSRPAAIRAEASITQGEEVKKISAWAAILFTPTLVGTVYGMNFEFMPETRWQLGYLFAILLMLLVSLVLYAVFKRRDWI